MSNIQGPPALFPFATPSETQHDSRLESAQQMPLVEEPQQAVPPIDSGQTVEDLYDSMGLSTSAPSLVTRQPPPLPPRRPLSLFQAETGAQPLSTSPSNSSGLFVSPALIQARRALSAATSAQSTDGESSTSDSLKRTSSAVRVANTTAKLDQIAEKDVRRRTGDPRHIARLVEQIEPIEPAQVAIFLPSPPIRPLSDSAIQFELPIDENTVTRPWSVIETNEIRISPRNRRCAFLNRLPIEIHDIIMRYLTLRELVQMCRVCRAFAPSLCRPNRSPYDPLRPYQLTCYVADRLQELGRTPEHTSVIDALLRALRKPQFCYENLAQLAGRRAVPLDLAYWWVWQSGSVELLSALLEQRWQLFPKSLDLIERELERYQPSSHNALNTDHTTAQTIQRRRVMSEMIHNAQITWAVRDSGESLALPDHWQTGRSSSIGQMQRTKSIRPATIPASFPTLIPTHGWLYNARRLQEAFIYAYHDTKPIPLIKMILLDPWHFLVALPRVDAMERSREKLSKLISLLPLEQLLTSLEKHYFIYISHAVCRSLDAMSRLQRTRRCTTMGWNAVLLHLSIHVVLTATGQPYFEDEDIRRLEELYKYTCEHGKCTRSGIDRALRALYVDQITCEGPDHTITVQKLPVDCHLFNEGRGRVDHEVLARFAAPLIETQHFSTELAGRLMRVCTQRASRSSVSNNHTHASGTTTTNIVSQRFPIAPLLPILLNGRRYPAEDADWCLRWCLSAYDLTILHKTLANAIFSPQGISWCLQHALLYDDLPVYKVLLLTVCPNQQTLEQWRQHITRRHHKVARLMMQHDGGRSSLMQEADNRRRSFYRRSSQHEHDDTRDGSGQFIKKISGAATSVSKEAKRISSRLSKLLN
jgi:hypothetical protein